MSKSRQKIDKTKKMEGLEEIKELYPLVERKTDFISHLAAVTGRKYNTIRRVWIGQGWCIPDQFVEVVLAELKKWIK